MNLLESHLGFQDRSTGVSGTLLVGKVLHRTAVALVTRDHSAKLPVVPLA